MKVNSVPQPEHQKSCLPSVDRASTRINSPLQGKSGKNSLCSTVASRVEGVLAQRPRKDPNEGGRHKSLRDRSEAKVEREYRSIETCARTGEFPFVPYS